MKGFLLFILIVGLAGLFVYKLPPKSICDTPIGYKLGIIDTKFNLTEQSVLDSVKVAADVWNNQYSKPIFYYDPDAQLTISFIYDERAELNTSISDQKSDLDTKNSELKVLIQNYERDLAVFQKKLADYNLLVDQKNLQGGVSMETYDDLVRQRQFLQSEGEELNSRAKKLNLATNDFNVRVHSLNEDVSQFNQKIAAKPEEGVYNFTDNTITIFFANNKSELIHTLAHELGHVLEMDHLEDPLAIMHPYSSETTKPAKEDQVQLQNICQPQPVYQFWLNRFIGIWYRLPNVFNQLS